VITDPEIFRELGRLNGEQNWQQLADRAIALAAEHPDDAHVAAFAAHALRKLGALAEGYDYAQRAAAIDPGNLFALNRLSLLANLTGNYGVAYAAAATIVDRETTDHDEALNLAITIVNAIHAASKVGRISDAIERLSPIIARLDHHELHFNAACLYALGRDERAFHYMRRALSTGKKKSAFDDADLDPIRTDPRFRELLARDWIAEHAAMLRRAASQLGPPIEPYFEDDPQAAALLQAHRVRAERKRDADTAARAELTAEDFLDPEELRVASYAPVDRTRSPAIETAIDAAIDDPAGYLVYADWLLERDNLRGQLILASHRCAEAVTESERMLAFTAWGALVAVHARRWLGTAVDLIAQTSRTRWYMGFITELVFDTGYNPRAGDSAGELLAAVLELPVCRFLRRLEVRNVFARPDELEYADIVAVLCSRHLPHLRVLVIAPVDYRLAMTTLDATGLIEQQPQLEELELGSAVLTIGNVDGSTLPNLRRLALRTTGLSRAALAPILATRWPHLEELELWFGREAQCEVDHSDLWRILSGLAVPALERLRLRDTDFTDALCTSLVDAAILPQLKLLDISMGSLTDDGANTLLANAGKLHHLESVIIDDRDLTSTVRTRLQIALPNFQRGEPRHPSGADNDYDQADDFLT
jgi:uncharacterized protein (TIGR02996 family)